MCGLASAGKTRPGPCAQMGLTPLFLAAPYWRGKVSDLSVRQLMGWSHFFVGRGQMCQH